MNRTEIKDFKKFLNDRDIFMMFTQNYRQNHLTSNPPTLDAYLEKAKAESVIPLAFVYPKSIADVLPVGNRAAGRDERLSLIQAEKEIKEPSILNSLEQKNF